MKCKNCGYQLKEGMKFCENCGTKVEVQAQKQPAAQPTPAPIMGEPIMK